MEVEKLKCPNPNEYEFPYMYWENDKGERFEPNFRCDNCPDYPPADFQPTTAVVQFATEISRKYYLVNKNGSYGGDDLVATGGSSYSKELVLALTRPTFKERLKSLIRCRSWLKTAPLDQAILHAAHRCERCMNSLAWKYGLDWGYPPFSKEWQKSRTECEVCR